MKYICAWCGCETVPPDGNEDELETNGICEKCYLIIMARINALRSEARAINRETAEFDLRI